MGKAKDDVTSLRPLMKSEGRGGLNGTLFNDVMNSSDGSVAGVRILNLTFNEKQVGSIEILYWSSNGLFYHGVVSDGRSSERKKKHRARMRAMLRFQLSATC